MKKLWEKYSYVIILIAITYISVFMLFNRFEKPTDFVQVTIEEGQSLWELADRFSDRHSMTSAQFVRWVEEKNGISGDRIFPGEQLRVPVLNDDETSPEMIVLAGQ